MEITGIPQLELLKRGLVAYLVDLLNAEKNGKKFEDIPDLDAEQQKVQQYIDNVDFNIRKEKAKQD